MSKSRMIDPKSLGNIIKNSEVVENGSVVNEDKDEVVLVRKKSRKVTKAISISLPLDSYNEYIAYLNENDVESGSELIRSLLKEKGIIS